MLAVRWDGSDIALADIVAGSTAHESWIGHGMNEQGESSPEAPLRSEREVLLVYLNLGEEVPIDLSMRVPASMARDEVVAAYRQACARSDAIVGDCPDLTQRSAIANPGEATRSAEPWRRRSRRTSAATESP